MYPNKLLQRLPTGCLAAGLGPPRNKMLNYVHFQLYPDIKGSPLLLLWKLDVLPCPVYRGRIWGTCFSATVILASTALVHNIWINKNWTAMKFACPQHSAFTHRQSKQIRWTRSWCVTGDSDEIILPECIHRMFCWGSGIREGVAKPRSRVLHVK